MYTLYTCCPQRNRLVWPVKMCVSDHVTLLLGNPPKAHNTCRVRAQSPQIPSFLGPFLLQVSSYRFHPPKAHKTFGVRAQSPQIPSFLGPFLLQVSSYRFHPTGFILQRLTRHSELGPKVLKYHHFLDLFSYRFHPSHSAPTTPASPAPISSTSCWLYPWALQFPDPHPEKLAHPLIYFRSLLHYHLSTGMHWPSCLKLHLLVFFLLHFHLSHIPSYIFYLYTFYVMSSSQ